jgi:uncharacterized RDD family membrane protein YckC
MNSTSAPRPAVRPYRREVVIGFSPETVHAPFLLRCGALLVDYLLVVAAPVVFLFAGRVFGQDGSALIHGELNNAGWLVAIIIAVADLVLLPAVAGQSIGKMFAGIRIVCVDGSPANVRSIVFRQTVGYLTAILTFGGGFFLAAFNRSGRSLHDLISRTVVIRGRKEIVE